MDVDKNSASLLGATAGTHWNIDFDVVGGNKVVDLAHNVSQDKQKSGHSLLSTCPGVLPAPQHSYYGTS